MSTLLISTSPVPLGVIAMLPSVPSAIVITPEFEPALVFNVKSPVPFVVIVTSALLSPTRTVSASS